MAYRCACLDFSYAAPYYWSQEYEKVNPRDPEFDTEIPKTFLNEDYCAIENQHFFVRGLIHLPIIGSAETFCWGVWGSLSRENFEKLLLTFDDTDRAELPEIYAQIQEPGSRPIFEIGTNRPSSLAAYHHGITAERVREIMMSRLSVDD